MEKITEPLPKLKGRTVRKQNLRWKAAGPRAPQLKVGQVARLRSEGSTLISTAGGGAKCHNATTLKLGARGTTDLKIVRQTNFRHQGSGKFSMYGSQDKWQARLLT